MQGLGEVALTSDSPCALSNGGGYIFLLTKLHPSTL